MFIELTGKDSNEKMSFNVNHIVFVAPHKTVKGDKDEGTMIVTITDTDDSYFVVQESYKAVKKLLCKETSVFMHKAVDRGERRLQEERLQEYYEYLLLCQKKHAHEGEYTKADARLDGFLKALELLGIKIG